MNDYPLLRLHRREYVPHRPTCGSFVWESQRGVMRLAGVRSLELPWYDNDPRRSCVVSGLREMRWTRSNRLSAAAGHDVYTWEILNVPGRTGIRIHSGNFAGVKLSHSLGCPLTCKAWEDINNDGDIDGVRSKEALADLHRLLKPYELSGLKIHVFDPPGWKA